MPITPQKHYKAKHQFDCQVTPNIQANVSGGGGSIRSGYDAVLGKTVVGSVNAITTTHEIVSYNVAIRYNGPIDIGDRLIQSTQIPGYENDAVILKKAKSNTGISNPDSDSCCYKIFACITCLTLTCCLFKCCFDRHHRLRREELNSEITKLGDEKVSKAVAELIKAADAQVDQRIAYAKQNQRVSGSGAQGQGGQGARTISEADFKQFQDFQQFQKMQQMQQQQPPQQYGSSPLLVPQYIQQGQQGVQLVAIRGASNSTSGYATVPTSFPTASAPPAYGTIKKN